MIDGGVASAGWAPIAATSVVCCSCAHPSSAFGARSQTLPTGTVHSSPVAAVPGDRSATNGDARTAVARSRCSECGQASNNNFGHSDGASIVRLKGHMRRTRNQHRIASSGAVARYVLRGQFSELVMTNGLVYLRRHAVTHSLAPARRTNAHREPLRTHRRRPSRHRKRCFLHTTEEVWERSSP